MFQLITELLAYAGIPLLCAAVIGIIWRLCVLHERELDDTWDAAYEIGWYAGLDQRNAPVTDGADLADRNTYGTPLPEPRIRLSKRHSTLPGDPFLSVPDPHLCYNTLCPMAEVVGLPHPRAICPPPPSPVYRETGNVVTLRGLPVLERSPELPEPVHVHPRQDPPFSTSQYTELDPEAVQDASGDSSGVTSQDTWLQDREASVVMWRIREEEKSRNWRNREARVIARTERDWWAAS